MTPRLVLASSPVSVEERYGVFAGAGSTEPSFGLLCLAASARQGGADVAVVEASARNLDLPSTLRDVLAFNPDVVGLTATTSEVVRAGELAAQIKQARPDILTILGGCHVTAIPEETLQAFPAFDMAVVGEGEATLGDILRERASGTRMPGGIAGTVTREGGTILRNERRPLIANLDDLPLPAWDLLEGFPGLFHPSPGRIKRWPCASVVLTRGCPNRCVFCDRSVFGNRCRAYSPTYALNIVRDLYRHHGVRELLIEDDTFVISKDRVREFCERLMAEKMAISWSCLGRADRVDPDLLALMRKAGCWHISYGIESGDPDILKTMHKHLDLEQIRQAVRWSRDSGMRTKGFFIVGFPGETVASLERTKAFACSLPLDDISVMQMTPFPGSELYGMADEHGIFTRDWRQMNVLNTVFVPHGFTRAALEQARSDILKAFYLRPGVMWRQGLHALRHPSLISGVLGGFRAFRNAVRRT